MNQIQKLKITCLVEDTTPLRPFWGEHGLSLLLEADNKTILFDSGASGDVLLHNLDKLEIDPNNIDAFVLSHTHGDHSGGLRKIASKISSIPFFCPSDSFSKYMPEYQNNLRILQDLHFSSSDLEIFPGIYISKEKDGNYSPLQAKESNLVINLYGKGLALIVGCAHHGIENIINNAKERYNLPIYGLVGGLHLKDSTEEEIIAAVSLIKEENIRLLLPNHCTGHRAIEALINELPESTILLQKSDSGTFHTGKTVEF